MSGQKGEGGQERKGFIPANRSVVTSAAAGVAVGETFRVAYRPATMELGQSTGPVLEDEVENMPSEVVEGGSYYGFAD